MRVLPGIRHLVLRLTRLGEVQQIRGQAGDDLHVALDHVPTLIHLPRVVVPPALLENVGAARKAVEDVLDGVADTGGRLAGGRQPL
jgi:hypothetical protein